MLRLFIVMFLMLPSLSTGKQFNYSCALEKPLQDSTFPTIGLSSLELQVSHRVTHQLATRVIAIFLKEIFDYEPISFNKYLEQYHPIERLTEKQIEYAAVIELSRQTEPAMNLEVWITPDPHVIFPGTVTQGGSTSDDLTRFGLFIRESSTTRDYIYSDFTSSNPRYHEIVNEFKINNEMEKILLRNVEKTSSFDGVYRPRRCNSTTEPCIAVLTSSYNDMSFFIKHVERFELRMNVYFLGDRLYEVVRLLNSILKINVNKLKKTVSPNFLVFHFTPSEIIDGSIQYKPIQMPKCELYKNETNNCRYEIIPVSAYFNDDVKKSEDLIEILRRFHFRSMKPLIEMYDRYAPEIEKIYMQKKANEEVTESVEDYYNKIACKWLQQNKQVYTIGNKESWIRNPDGQTDSQMEISIGGIFPNPGTGREYDGIPVAVDMAVNMINDNSSLLSGYKLVVKRVNSDCKPDLILKRFISYYSHRKHLIGVLGPSCSEAVEPIAAISKQFKMSVITYSAEGISFDEREHYPFFFRTIGETKQHEDVYIKLFKQMNWNRVAAVTEDGTKYTEYITNMGNKLPSVNMKLIENKKITRETNEDKRLEYLKTSLKDLMDNNAKIIIADVHDHILLQSIMCTASKLDMTAKHGFVWFLPVYVSIKINDTLMQNINGSSCTEVEMRNALDGHLTLSYASFGNDLDTIEGGQTIAGWKETYLRRTGMNHTEFSDYAGFTYDAIWVYVKALQQLIQEDSPKHRYMRNLYSDQTMERLATLIHEMNFQGVSGQISFSRGGSRFTDINILQWQKREFVLVGKYKPKISNRTIVDSELTMNDKLTWASGEIPKDGRESCRLQMIADLFHTNCHKVNTFFAVIFCILAILLCSAASFFFWKRRYDKKIVESEKIYGGILGIIDGAELAKWEIARENVVINRRIGEGAFGTVYGGEALIDEADGWTAVAIKTLKPGSNAENRLDFLAESETMKRFDHKNIVQLLAVCLQAEPLYAIMEYMLYGDLKTYLLARRHLVNDKISDDSDVSPKRLTLMALDIARGLSYLASKNFVHRDVACRNCMINAQRVVKIGDFGMARQTFESEYYRFVRKGMLPVRWMAPESVEGGIFSHASDMWSYGVTLFEIVTLCAFPFQGMTNSEVFEHVKQGNSIKIPATCKPHLQAVMSSCFNIDPKKRPGASTIVEFISKNPRILTPCMDVPKPCLDYQVNLIDGDQDPVERFEQMMDLHRDRSHTPATIEFLRTSVSSSALQNHQVTHHEDPSSFEYLDMNLSRKPNGICLSEFRPDLTAMLPNGNYNPVEPLLQTRPEISKSNLSLMKYMPMCGFGKNSNRSSPDECTSAL